MFGKVVVITERYWIISVQNQEKIYKPANCGRYAGLDRKNEIYFYGRIEKPPTEESNIYFEESDSKITLWVPAGSYFNAQRAKKERTDLKNQPTLWKSNKSKN